MGSFHIPLTDEIALEQLFADMNSTAKDFVRSGFYTVAQALDSARSALLRAAIETVGLNSEKSQSQLASTLGIDPQDATGAVAAMSMLAAITSSRSEPTERLLQVMIDAQLV